MLGHLADERLELWSARERILREVSEVPLRRLRIDQAVCPRPVDGLALAFEAARERLRRQPLRIAEALDQGVNLFDTAPNYAATNSERILGAPRRSG